MNMHAAINSPLVVHAARFVFRLRRHGIECAVEAFRDDGRVCVKVRVGMRRINVFNDGACTRSLTRTDDHFDGRAFLAQSHRMHALYLTMAAEARKLGLLAMARADITDAIAERKHHERARPR